MISEDHTELFPAEIRLTFAEKLLVRSGDGKGTSSLVPLRVRIRARLRQGTTSVVPLSAKKIGAAEPEPTSPCPCSKTPTPSQLSVMQIMQLLLSGQIEQKTAGLLFYGLQIASSNLKHINFEPETKNEIVIDPRKTAETRLGQPLWKNSDFEETSDGKINLDDYDLPDLTIRVIDQMKKQSGMEPTPRDVRERYAPLDSDRPNGAEKEIKTEPEKK